MERIFLGPFIFIIGASVGSFLNVLIDRLPKDKSILGRSHCDFCGKKLKGADLIPIFSFIFLRGRCRYCHKKLSFQYPLVEAITGLTFLSIFNLQPSVFSLLTLWGIASCLIVIFFSDVKYHLISDYILLALLVFSALSHLQQISQFPNFLISGLVVSAPIFLIYFLSKERAMGLGDVYLAAIIGFLLGWKAGFIALYVAFVTGAIFGLILIILKKKKIKSKIPFGPFLVVGALTLLFWSKEIFDLIFRLYGIGR